MGGLIQRTIRVRIFVLRTTRMPANTAGTIPIDLRTPRNNGKGLVITAPAIVVHCVTSLRIVLSQIGFIAVKRRSSCTGFYDTWFQRRRPLVVNGGLYRTWVHEENKRAKKHNNYISSCPVGSLIPVTDRSKYLRFGLKNLFFSNKII